MGQAGAEFTSIRSDAGVAGNERLTAQAGAVLVVLAGLVTLTAAYARAWLGIHVFVGVFFLGPLMVMVGSTGYRFVRYYRRAPAFVRRGKPPLALRLLAPLLLVSTLALALVSTRSLRWGG